MSDIFSYFSLALLTPPLPFSHILCFPTLLSSPPSLSISLSHSLSVSLSISISSALFLSLSLYLSRSLSISLGSPLSLSLALSLFRSLCFFRSPLSLSRSLSFPLSSIPLFQPFRRASSPDRRCPPHSKNEGRCRLYTFGSWLQFPWTVFFNAQFPPLLYMVVSSLPFPFEFVLGLQMLHPRTADQCLGNRLAAAMHPSNRRMIGVRDPFLATSISVLKRQFGIVHYIVGYQFEDLWLSKRWQFDVAKIQISWGWILLGKENAKRANLNSIHPVDIPSRKFCSCTSLPICPPCGHSKQVVQQLHFISLPIFTSHQILIKSDEVIMSVLKTGHSRFNSHTHS